MDTPFNVFVLGTDDFNLIKLKALRYAPDYNFIKLLDYSEFRSSDEYDVEALLKKCRERLDAHEGSYDAIVGYFDFPVTDMVPILAREYGMRSASLEAILKCEHKYWSRLEQRQCIPDHIPEFAAFDPFDDNALANLGLEFPFWIKPIKSFRSYLGFRINNEDDWNEAIPIIRENIRKISDPFDFIFDYLKDSDIEGLEDEKTCLAEGIISGRQCTIEGYMLNGKFHPLGVVDSIRESNGSSFQRYEYPSKLPLRIQMRISEISEKVIKHIGFDNSCFNIEYFYNDREDELHLLEINPRISQSHGDLFHKVDGTANHEAMIEVALGRKLEFPHREGAFGHAAKFMWRVFIHDGIIHRVPTEEDKQIVRHSYPGTLMDIHVDEGVRLSELLNQDSYSYELADIYMGASTQQNLLADYDGVKNLLPFEIEEIPEGGDEDAGANTLEPAEALA
jgi:hypothetical protein